MKTPTLETDRLILRPISLGDAPAIQKHFNNWNIIKYTRAPWPFPDDGAEAHIRDTVLSQIEAEQHFGWVLVFKGQTESVGRIDYRLYENPPDRGFWLAQPYWGQGLMTEAVTATQDFMFFEAGIDKITVKNSKSNIGSHRIKEKCGAVYLYDESEPCSHLDEPVEVWEVTRENWAEIRGHSTD